MKKIGERSTNSATFAILKELAEMFTAGNGLDGYFDAIYCSSFSIGATELVESDIAVIAGVVAGTATASKAVVLDANKAVDAVRTAALYLGTSGSETQVAATAAEINVLASVTAGTVSASKALVVDANRDLAYLRNLTLGVNGASGVAGSLVVKDGANPGATATLTHSDFAMIDGITAGTAAASKAVVLNSGGDVTWVDGGDISLGTTTGTKIGTGTNQKLGFYNATPVVQQRTISYGHTWDLTGTSGVNMSNLTSLMNEFYNIVGTIANALDVLGLAVKVDHSVW